VGDVSNRVADGAKWRRESEPRDYAEYFSCTVSTEICPPRPRGGHNTVLTVQLQPHELGDVRNAEGDDDDCDLRAPAF